MATGVGLTHFACIVKLAATKTLYLVEESLWCLIQVKLNTEFLFKFSNSCYHGNKGGYNKKFEWLRLIGRPPTQKKPSLVQKSGSYFKFDQILVNFVRKLQILVTMASGVGVTQSKLS